MKKLNSLFEEFYKADKKAKVKFSLKILRRLVKNPSLLIWFPVEIEGEKIVFRDYYAKFKSGNGANFIISLGLTGNESSSVTYEFEVGFGTNRDCRVELGHIIDRVELSNSACTAVMGRGTKLPTKYGYLIMALYNKVATQLQAVVAQNKLRKPLMEALEALKMQMT